MSEATAEQRAAAQALLAAAVGAFDTNHDGAVDESDEVPPFMRMALMLWDRNHDQKVDVADFLPMVDALDTNHDGLIDIADLPSNMRGPLEALDGNGDGRINREDLAPLLNSLADRNHDGRIDLGDLPAATRDGLFGMLGRADSDGAERADLRPIYEALQATAAGSRILENLDRNGDGRISGQELALAWASLPDPAHIALRPDGTVDLEAMTPAVRDALLATFDATGDGRVNEEDLRAFLDALNMDEANAAVLKALDANGDGKVDLADLPGGVGAAVLRSLDADGDGRISVDELPSGFGGALLSSLDTNGDGRIRLDDLPPRLRAAVREALAGVGRPAQGSAGGETVDVTDLPAEAGSALVGRLGMREDGTIDLSDLPPEAADALLASLDRDGDGTLTLADLAGAKPDAAGSTGGGGAVEASSAAGAAGAAVVDAISADVSVGRPGQTTAIEASSPFATPLLLLLLVFIGGALLFARRVWKGRRSLDRKRMIDATAAPSSSSGSYSAPYTAPISIPTPSPLVAAPGPGAAATSDTRQAPTPPV